MNEQQIIGVLEARIEAAQAGERMYRAVAHYLAGYFHSHAKESGLPVEMPGDLVKWAIRELGPDNL